MEKYINLSLNEFSREVAAKKSMPGGGSVAAYSATLASSLASMVANFTIGKKKYLEYEDDIKLILEQAYDLEKECLELVDLDIEEYLPLAEAYKMTERSEEEKKIKEIEIQRCLKNAAKVPLDTLKTADKIAKLHKELLVKGSRMLISDVGVGVQMLKASVLSAKLNILINIKYIDDVEFVQNYKKEMDNLVERITDICDYVYENVVDILL